MSGVYVLSTAGAPPITAQEARDHLRLHSDADNTLLAQLVLVASDAAESYTRRELRANTWTLLLDEFSDPPGGDRICLRRDPVDTIDSVVHLVSGSGVTVVASTYFLKRGVQASEIVLDEDKSWPEDTDAREQAITVTFTTKADERWLETGRAGIFRIVAYLYEHRGDEVPTRVQDLVRASGASAILDQFRISRV